MDAQDEAVAIAQLKQGDIRGLKVLVDAYQVPALRLAYLITQDLKIAEDLVSEAFVRVFKRINQFDDSRPFSPWFFRIISNDAKKYLSRISPVQSLENLAEIVPSVDVALTDPADVFDLKEFKTMVQDALRHLSPDHREIIVLRYYMEMSEHEMAEHLRLPIGTVKSRMYSAREQLRRIFLAYRNLEDRS